jgi:hypothetical protein
MKRLIPIGVGLVESLAVGMAAMHAYCSGRGLSAAALGAITLLFVALTLGHAWIEIDRAFHQGVLHGRQR